MSHKLLLKLTYLFLHVSASSLLKRKRKQMHPHARKLRALAIEEVPLPDGKLISMTIEETVRTRAMATFNRRGDLRGRDGHDINNVRSIKTPTYVHPRARFASFSLGENDLTRERYLWSRDAATSLAAASLSLIQRDSHYADGNHSSFSPAGDRCGDFYPLQSSSLALTVSSSKTLLHREISRSENSRARLLPQIHDESQTPGTFPGISLLPRPA